MSFKTILKYSLGAATQGQDVGGEAIVITFLVGEIYNDGEALKKVFLLIIYWWCGGVEILRWVSVEGPLSHVKDLTKLALLHSNCESTWLIYELKYSTHTNLT